MGEKIRFHTDLEVFQLAFNAAMQIYDMTKSFPRGETTSLVDQIRRSSRSVCANLSEAWRRRRYRAAFCNCLNHVEAEAAETQVWLDYALRCEYINENTHASLNDKYDHIISMIVNMITNPEKWAW